MNYYSHHIGDYLTATAHLTLLEHGAFRRMLDVYYSTEKPLPKERKQVYRLVLARAAEEQEAVDTVLAEFFMETDAGWVNQRCEEELALCNKNRENGKKGGRPSKKANPNGSEGEPNEKPEQSEVKPSEIPNETQTEPKPKSPITHYPLPNNSVEAAVALPLSVVSATEPPPPDAIRREVQIAKLVRAIDSGRGVAPKLLSTDPRVVAWATDGVTDEQIREACELLLADRKVRGEAGAINAGFLDVFLQKVLHPPQAESGIGKAAKPATAKAQEWFLSASGIEAKAKELGYQPPPDTPLGIWRNEVFALAGVTQEQLRAAQVDRRF